MTTAVRQALANRAGMIASGPIGDNSVGALSCKRHGLLSRSRSSRGFAAGRQYCRGWGRYESARGDMTDRRGRWFLVASRGSHRQYKHPTKPGRVTVAGKPSDDLAPGTRNSILKQAGLTEKR